MKIYVTKYALTDAIYEIEAETGHDPTLVRARLTKDHFEQYFHKGEYFLTIEEAMAGVEDMRTKKIASLKKQIAKLEKLTNDRNHATDAATMKELSGKVDQAQKEYGSNQSDIANKKGSSLISVE